MKRTINKARRVTKLDAEIGFRIRQIRQNKKITQAQVAGQCGISYQQLQKYELGRNRISAIRLVQIAQALETDPGEFLKPANDKALPVTLKGQHLQNLDRAAASRWQKLQNNRQKYILLELMDMLQAPTIQPPDTLKRE